MDAMPLNTYIILWFGGFLAGFVDSIAGGGGLIALPILLSAGIAPHQALGTNKLQSSFGSFTASVNYARNGLVNFSGIRWGILCTALGAAIGTLTIQLVAADFLKHIIPLMLLIIFLYMLKSPQFGDKDQSSVMPARLFYLVFGMGLGFYDGFFGPGTGSFWAAAFVMLLGIDLKKATAHTKIMNFTSNIMALVAFAAGNNIIYSAGAVMGTGQILGAYCGSKLVIVKHTRFIRIFFLTVIALTILKLMYSTYFNNS